MTARISAYSRSSGTAATASAVWMLSLRWVANSHWQCGCYVSLTLSLPQPVKFLGWKVHTYTPADSIFDAPITNLPSVLCILIEILSPAHAKGEKSLNDFKFGTSTGHFPSDSATSMAVKGLSIRWIANIHQMYKIYIVTFIGDCSYWKWCVDVASKASGNLWGKVTSSACRIFTVTGDCRCCRCSMRDLSGCVWSSQQLHLFTIINDCCCSQSGRVLCHMVHTGFFFCHALSNQLHLL